MKYQNILIGCVLIFRFSRIPYIPQKTSNTPCPENNREKLKHPSHFKFCVFLEFFKSNSGLQSINRKGKSSQKPNLWKNLPAWQGNFRQRIAMTNELSNRVEQNHCSGQCACKPSTKKLVDMSSNNNMIILVAVLITTASAIGLYVYLDTNSSEPINPQTGMLASEHRAPSSTAQGTASVSMEELLEKKKQAVLSYSREGNFPDTRARLKNSFDDKTLTANEYYGELAHMLSISADAPASIIKEILESGNKYGRDVLLGNLGSNLELPNSISAAERNAIFDMVNGAKPELGGGIHELGFSDVFRYEDWLKSLKAYAPDEAIFHKTLENLIQTRMADPREMLALQSAFRDEKFLNHIDPIARKRYLFYISGYIKDYPGNSVAQSINKARQDYLDEMKR